MTGMSLLEKHFITGFFSVQRLHGFRQVVTHVQSQQKLNCRLHVQGRQLSDSHKSAGSGPVRGPIQSQLKWANQKTNQNNKAKPEKQQQTNKNKHNQNKHQPKKTEKGLQPAVGIHA